MRRETRRPILEKKYVPLVPVIQSKIYFWNFPTALYLLTELIETMTYGSADRVNQDNDLCSNFNFKQSQAKQKKLNEGHEVKLFPGKSKQH